MMKRIAICLALAGSPQLAAAQSVQDQVISQLQDQGFTQITVNRTWLGRVRVVAYRDNLRRELVFNPQTGEILRDYWGTIEDGDDHNGVLIFNPGGGQDDDDEDDDDEDDDDDDDEDDDDDDEEDEEDDEEDDEEEDDEADD